MPTILRRDGFRFVIWFNDHPPPHVQVIRAGNELIIDLGLEGSLPTVNSNRGMSNREENAALLIVALNNRMFLEQWEEIHGKIDDN
jgi:hypothetical protein